MAHIIQITKKPVIGANEKRSATKELLLEEFSPKIKHDKSKIKYIKGPACKTFFFFVKEALTACWHLHDY